MTLNGVRLPSATRLAGTLRGVVFSPAHLSLVRDGPEERRRFVDGACCQLRPGHIGVMTEYHKVLQQRNAFLKRCRETGSLTATADDMLEIWDTTLAIAVARRWQQLLQKARPADVAAGFSTAGPHREDLLLLLDGKPARTYGSQGQQRSAVLALKMAEATLLQQITEEPPVAFLDDVMSELDISRQDYILNHIRDWQVFITCCEPTAGLRMTAGRVFEIKQGVISE